MKKIFLIPMFVVLAFGIVFATAYAVAHLNLTVGVAEPFSVEYAVLGDGHGGYAGLSCNDAGTIWFTSTSTSIPTGDFYPMESRYVCVRITNKAEALVPYTIHSYVEDGNTTCASAFGLPKTLNGDANANVGGLAGVTITGAEVKIAADATPVSGCNVVIDVARG